MRLAPSTVALAVLTAVASACAPPKPSEPETTAVYDKPPAAAPAPVTRTSVNEPEGETLGSPAAPAPAAPPAAVPEVAPAAPAAPAAPPAATPPSAAPAAPSTTTVPSAVPAK